MDKNKKLNKQSFIGLSLGLSIIAVLIVSLAIVPALGVTICGFIPVGLVAFACAIGQILGTIYYVNKHKFAYGDTYEAYQIINALIYGIQNVLRVILVVVLVNICAVPVFVIFVIIYGAYVIWKIFG